MTETFDLGPEVEGGKLLVNIPPGLQGGGKSGLETWLRSTDHFNGFRIDDVNGRTATIAALTGDIRDLAGAARLLESLRAAC